MKGFELVGRIADDWRGPHGRDQLWLTEALAAMVERGDLIALSPREDGYSMRAGYARVRALATGIEVDGAPRGDVIVVESLEAVTGAAAGDYVFVARAIGEAAFR